MKITNISLAAETVGSRFDKDNFITLTEQEWQIIKNSTEVKFHPASLNENMNKKKLKLWAPISKTNKRPYVIDNMDKREFRKYLLSVA